MNERSPKTQTPDPIWNPSTAELTQSNIAIWMHELGFDAYSEFHTWTTDNRQDFWAQSLKRLRIQFRTPPQKILDESLGPTKTIWLAGATINIAENCFHADPNATAIVVQSPGGPIRKQSYQELRQRANQVANSLVEAGFKVGDAFGVVMPMTDWSVAIYLGIVLAGCTAVSIADSFAPPEIATRLKISGAKAVFTYDHQNRAGKQLPLFRRVAEASEIPAIVLSTDEILSTDLREQDLAWSEFLVYRNEFEALECGVQETINVLFSSGTTGDPKAIPWNHLTPLKCAIDGFCHQNIQPGDVCAWPTNLGWMMGPWLIFATLINRATVALYEDAPLGPGFGEFIQNAGVTMLGVVPTIVKAWQATGDMESFDWSSIKAFSSTGESSQAETMTYLASLAGGKPIIEYCGGTEIGGGYVSSVVVLPNYPAAFNSPAVGLDFVLLDPETSQPATAGEVFLVPPSIGLSSRLINRDHFETYYANTPIVAGIPQLRRHGDHFRSIETESGLIYVAGGRADDTMNLGGIKISSAEIERVLNQVTGVTETAAVAYSEEGGPDRLVVFAVVESGLEDADLLKTMNGLLKTQLNPLFKAQALKLIPTMPRTASGKVMRRKLREELSPHS
ncbi:MAG: acetyl-CoA synthetase [Mariniblastus sp.]|jgi:acetyl-CoA synthetase